MTEKLLVPDIGDFENVEIIEILVKVGQEIRKDDPIITIESDKSSVEIPSTVDGKVVKIDVKIGDKVSKGDLLLTVNGLGSPISETEKDIVPKNTENLIREAESSLKKNQETNADDKVNLSKSKKNRASKNRKGKKRNNTNYK